MDYAVSPDALNYAYESLKLLLTTALALLTFSIGFLEKILGVSQAKRCWFWPGWLLLLLSVPALVAAMLFAPTVAATMGSDVVCESEAVAEVAEAITGPATGDAAATRTQALTAITLDSWRDFSLCAWVGTATWFLGVLALAVAALCLSGRADPATTTLAKPSEAPGR